MRKLLSLAFLALVATAAAHADTYTDFSVQATFNSPGNTGMFTGDLIYDNTTMSFTNSSLLTTSGFPNANGSNDQPLTLYGQGPVQTGPNTFADNYYVLVGNATGAGSYIYLEGTTFSNASSVTICTTSTSCPAVTGYGDGGGPTSFNYQAISGQLTNVNQLSATPEPSSLLLLGTGILGVAGAARRRFLA